MREGVALEESGSSIGDEYPAMPRSSACSKARDQEETHDAVVVVQLLAPPRQYLYFCTSKASKSTCWRPHAISSGKGSTVTFRPSR